MKTIQELKAKYTEDELSSFPGDKKLRYEIFSPLFENLYEEKVIYYEKIIGIVRIEDLTMTPDSFQAKAIPHQCIERNKGLDDLFDQLETWTFGSSWDHIRLIDHSLNSIYAGWTVWTDPELVKVIEKLCRNKDYKEALSYFF
ncbi:hypothetical protein [Ekhidna sp.]|uniref:hypothetical protein n=1 Tax=Ekhidna sp. TaxID=2608089 RepID=UPI003B59E609